jgi:uncharacterized protein DUF6600
MKKVSTAIILVIALLAIGAPRSAEGSVSVSISFFHDQLSSSGRWAVAATYGEVWVPAGVAAGWAPYVFGEWVWTDYGWTWVSNDPFGDIPFHYGTWVWLDPYGWAWVPGTIWAPAWVTWAYTDDYIGWAPVPPSFVLSVGGYSGAPVVVSQTQYVFVPTNQFVGASVSTARVPVQQNTEIFTRATKNTSFTVSSGIVRVAGPPPARIEKATGKHLERVAIGRVKTAPTTISDAGIAKGQRLRVVAPAGEQKRVEAHTKEQRISATSPKTTGHETREESAQVSRPEQVKAEHHPQAAVTPHQPPSHDAQQQGQIKEEKPTQSPQNEGKTKNAKEKEKEKPKEKDKEKEQEKD